MENGEREGDPVMDVEHTSKAFSGITTGAFEGFEHVVPLCHGGQLVDRTAS